MTASTIADRIAKRLSWDDLDPSAVSKLVSLAREEDLYGWGLAQAPAQTGDVTSQSITSGNRYAEADLIAREELVICGLPMVKLILEQYGEGADFQPFKSDGDHCDAGSLIGRLTGPAEVLLQAERVLLNFLQRLSGVATATRSYVDAMAASPTRLLDTRKTTPGYRVLEKYAVACGGGFNHRIGLFDRVMLKDNHLAADDAMHGEALAGLVKKTREKWPSMIIELEVDSLDQIQNALDAGVDVFLLDNFSIDELSAAVSLIGNRAATEASGGIHLDSIPALCAIGLDFISTGATVHQSTWKDIGLDWVSHKE